MTDPVIFTPTSQGWPGGTSGTITASEAQPVQQDNEPSVGRVPTIEQVAVHRCLYFCMDRYLIGTPHCKWDGVSCASALESDYMEEAAEYLERYREAVAE